MSAQWANTLVEVLGVLVPILLYLERNARIARLERFRQHEENQSLLMDIRNEREFYPAHFHMESRGPLSAENIRLRGRRNE